MSSSKFRMIRKLVTRSKALVEVARRQPDGSPARVESYADAVELYAEARHLAGRIDGDELNAVRCECQDARNYAGG